MSKIYLDYFNIDPKYYAAVTADLIESGKVSWKGFYPHETFVKLLRKTHDVLSGKDPRSLWVEGAYGTGKSHAYVDDHGIDSVLQGDKILGTETHSLSKIDAWKKALTATRRRACDEELPCLFMLTTDGFANSYKDASELEKTCQDYYDMIKQHGTAAVDANLKAWLEETSELGCGDDITLLMAYYENGHEPESEVLHADKAE